LTADRPGTRHATRVSFLVAGFGLGCWAPLVPFAKVRVGVDDQVLGLLLLCSGLGSIGAMRLTGLMAARFGSRPIILVSSVGLAVFLPFLSIAPTVLTLGASLLAFGAAVGSLDAAINIHAVEVERASQRPLMSGFHGHFSIGAFAGSSLTTLLLSRHLSPPESMLICSSLMAVAAVLEWPYLLRQAEADVGPVSIMPRGIVLLLGILTGISFLAEGAVLDWGALLITSAGLVSVAQGGVGYMLFSITMTVGRLSGDFVVARVGDRAVLFWGSLIAIAGVILMITAPVAVLALLGFLLVGLGASNIVPVLFRRAGMQTVMPVGMAVAAITTVSYTSLLAGPAVVGFVAKAAGLPTAFGMIAVFLCLVTFTARVVTRDEK
jgi:predicted MFS family arabinose efflux permease